MPDEITEVLGDDITDADAEIFRKVIAGAYLLTKRNNLGISQEKLK